MNSAINLEATGECFTFRKNRFPREPLLSPSQARQMSADSDNRPPFCGGQIEDLSVANSWKWLPPTRSRNRLTSTCLQGLLRHDLLDSSVTDTRSLLRSPFTSPFPVEDTLNVTSGILYRSVIRYFGPPVGMFFFGNRHFWQGHFRSDEEPHVTWLPPEEQSFISRNRSPSGLNSRFFRETIPRRQVTDGCLFDYLIPLHTLMGIGARPSGSCHILVAGQIGLPFARERTVKKVSTIVQQQTATSKGQLFSVWLVGRVWFLEPWLRLEVMAYYELSSKTTGWAIRINLRICQLDIDELV